MTRWDSTDWAIIILALSIPIAELGLIIMRIFTNSPLSDNAANVIDGITKIIGGGLISILSIRYVNNKHKKENDTNNT